MTVERNPPNVAPDDSESLDDRLDEALEETFPASDPVAVHPHKPVKRPADPTAPTPKETSPC